MLDEVAVCEQTGQGILTLYGYPTESSYQRSKSTSIESFNRRLLVPALHLLPQAEMLPFVNFAAQMGPRSRVLFQLG